MCFTASLRLRLKPRAPDQLCDSTGFWLTNKSIRIENLSEVNQSKINPFKILQIPAIFVLRVLAPGEAGILSGS